MESITISSSLSMCSDSVSDIMILSDKKVDSVDREDYEMMNRSVVVHEEIVQAVNDECDSCNEKEEEEEEEKEEEEEEEMLDGEVVEIERDTDMASEDENDDEGDIVNKVPTAIEADTKQCDEDKAMEIAEKDDIICDGVVKDEPLPQNVPDDAKVSDMNDNNGTEFFLVSLTDQDSPKSVK